ncbi:uncharacterized protein si:ch211-102c2.8 isoform X3 [Oryzias latipes]
MESPSEPQHKEHKEFTSKLLFPDLSENSWNFSLDPQLFKVDICDLLLNAVDEQLDKLQIQHPKKDAVSSKQYWNSEVNLRRSKSLSKNMDLGYPASSETPMSCFNLMHSSVMEEKPGKYGFWEGPDSHVETQNTLSRKRNDKEENECHREKTIWRLERLLGDVCGQGDTGPPSASICTEDFVSRFKEEMVDLTLPDGGQQRGSNKKVKRNQICDAEELVNSLNEAGTALYYRPSQLGLRKSCAYEACVADITQVSDEKDSRSAHNPGDGDTGRCSVIKSVPNLDDQSNNQWNTETSTPTRSEPNSALERTCFHHRIQNRSSAVLSGRRESWGHVSSFPDQMSDGDICRGTPCSHAEQMTAETPCMHKEKRTLESFLEEQSVRCEIQELQKQSDSTGLHCCKQTWKNGSCIIKVKKDELKREPQPLTRQQNKELTDQGGLSMSQRTAMHLDQDAPLALKESDRLQALLEELENRKRCKEELGRQLGAECQRLNLFLEQSGVKQQGGLPQSLTVTEALTHLRTLGEQLRLFVGRLQKELESQKQVCEALKKEKETELSIQRQQLWTMKDQALTSLRERLIKEHMEELCSLKCTCMDKEWEGEAASLHRQLQAKDMELRHIQRNMDQWKEQTATRLASTFEEALIDELERCKNRLKRNRKASNTQVVGSDEDILGLKTAVCTSSLHAPDSSSSSSSSIFFPSDLAPFPPEKSEAAPCGKPHAALTLSRNQIL